MPAERTRGPKTEEGEGIQLTWTEPLEMAAPQQIAFAPAVTPGTFTEMSPVDDLESLPALFPSNPDGASPRKPGHGKKKGDNHVPRPPNAFILFRSSFIKSQHVSTEVETNHSTLSKIIGLTWQNMPHEERQFWHSKAKAAQAEHKRKWPDYAFRPLHAKGKGGTEKRKVREVGPKDMKRCAKIAELLVEGKKGADLQAAVQAFDRDHVPQVVTRFETPITARAFRRSSSEPAPDTDPSAPAFLVAASKPSKRRLRAVSSQPTMPPTPWSAPSSFPTTPSTPLAYSGRQFPPEAPAPYDAYHMMSQLSAFSHGAEYDVQGMHGAPLHAPCYPADAPYSTGHHVEQQPPPLSVADGFPPSKGLFPFFNPKLAEPAHLDVSFSEFLAQPLPGYTY
ncbi:hypothetical protein BV25DRAFT_1801700 [Artomyces pyxidatus]|uniref:Uncharacterized protein n=1 Tax=Artomyces pyxidatus TaxID=48021 RepID=A0ACB8T743_9AGAM|nr:hypothetical protein BV25DRAFT_1801700 [Artomyces pyxidatus]